MDSGELMSMLERAGCHKIQMSGQNVIATCPFAQWTHVKGTDEHPSFSILAGDQNKWNCFACGNKGALLKTFVHKFYDVSGNDLGLMDKNKLAQAVKQTNVKWTLVREQHSPAQSNVKVFDIKHYSRHLDLEKLPQYFYDRGVLKEQARIWKIGFNEKTQRIFIPIFDQHRIMVGYSERAITKEQYPKYKHALGFKRSLYLYGMHRRDKENPVACVSEGFMDVWSLDRCGITNAYATMGTAVSPLQIEFLATFKEVWIFAHNDEKDKQGNAPGLVSAVALRLKLQERGVTVLLAAFIDGKKDVGDWSIPETHEVLADLHKRSVHEKKEEYCPFTGEVFDNPFVPNFMKQIQGKQKIHQVPKPQNPEIVFEKIEIENLQKVIFDKIPDMPCFSEDEEVDLPEDLFIES
jgi:Toprim domain/DNA primase catalytic core, N-terminal domain